MSAWLTSADLAELDVLVHELCRSYSEHRERCNRCSAEPCSVLADWREHLETCKGCLGDAPLSFGLPCERYDAFIAHGNSCPRCNPCPALRKAVQVVVDWREARALLSRAERLRVRRLEGVA